MTLGAIDDEDIDSFQGSQKQRTNILKEAALKKCIIDGIYATYFKKQSGGGYQGARADFLGMRSGDNIYFFFNRCIYGIGEIVEIENTCVFKNVGNALYDFNDNDKCPFFCLFKSCPHFFKRGVDMDEVLMSNPNAFTMLRFFHQRSFIKLDDVENKALKSFIIQKNEEHVGEFDRHSHYDASNQNSNYNKIKANFETDRRTYSINAAEIFQEGVKKKKNPNMVSSETYVEGLILDYAKRKNRLLGYWDFITRQYPASPAKPSEYVDYMDIFGYRYVEGYADEGIISKYVVMELKTKDVNEDTILQIMKYVDWICKNFAHGDYSMIEAYIIGYNMVDNLLEKNKQLYTRNYIVSSKHNADRGIDVETGIWQNVKFVNYVDIFKSY